MENVKRAKKDSDLEPEIDYKNDINFLTRFACLFEGVNLACDKAEQLGINPEKNLNWVKPLAFQKYIQEREKDMKYHIQNWVVKK